MESTDALNSIIGHSETDIRVIEADRSFDSEIFLKLILALIRHA
jgi:hypothetical protein